MHSPYIALKTSSIHSCISNYCSAGVAYSKCLNTFYINDTCGTQKAFLSSFIRQLYM